MRAMRGTLIVMAAGLFLTAIVRVSYAFHAGGVAECGGCHSMHSPATGSTSLLVGTDASSTCLTCHQNAADTGPTEYHVSTAPNSLGSGQPPLQRTPGGDFGWLKKTYIFIEDGATITEDGATHGHNIVANDFDYLADPFNTTAPGGSFSSLELSCTSCHDPHGQWRRDSTNTIIKGGTVGVSTAPIIASGSYATNTTPGYTEPPPAGTALGVYRLLAGGSHAGGSVVYPGAPAAKVPDSYNRTEASTQTRAAYGYATTGGHAAWGSWCATCHGEMHSEENIVHPVDETLGSTIAGLYNAYVKSGDLTGTAALSFTSLVPFFENTGDYAVLATHAKNDDTFLNGPTTNDRVSCLSCHRAHASGWAYALRWNMEGEFMAYNSLYPGTDTTPTVPQFHRGRTGAETQAAYYDRPVTQFASYQRVLCNKCHAKD